MSRDAGLPQSSNGLVGLATDPQGRLLVATDLGLARLNGDRWDLVNGHNQGLESDTVTAVYGIAKTRSGSACGERELRSGSAMESGRIGPRQTD